MFVENIIRIMERKKMTRLELARRLGGVRPSYVTKILSGRENKPVKDESKNEIVVYQPNETMRLEVAIQDETVWLTQAQIADLFGTKRPAITKHLANIYCIRTYSSTNSEECLTETRPFLGVLS